jgi:translocator protein
VSESAARREAPGTRAQLAGLVLWLGLAFAAAAVGAVASADAGTFYSQLDRPGWAPPSWLFGPVWTLLYSMMGVAAWLVWKRAGFRGAATALSLFCVQLAANALWTWLFFGLRLGSVALAEIVVLLVLIVLTIISFGRTHRVAAALLVPYLLWVGFATLLTYELWRRNPQQLG